MRHAHAIATASERVAHMGGSGGKGDLTTSGAFTSNGPPGKDLSKPVSEVQVLVDARAAEVPYPLSGGWMDIHNLDGLPEVKQLDYTVMHLIHPSHVPVVDEVFTPTREEIAHWQGLIKAMEQRRQEKQFGITLSRSYGGRGPRGDRPHHAGHGAGMGSPG